LIEEDPLAERRVTVKAAVGLHARPAAVFVKAVNELKTPVTLRKPEGNPVNAGSILAVLTLNVQANDDVILESENEAALDKLVDVIENGLGE
jgi:phosphocarrier protein